MSSNYIKQTIVFIAYYLFTIISTTDYAVHASHKSGQCTYETQGNKIISIQKSKDLGATLLGALQMNSVENCTAACCGSFYGTCNMAFYHETDTEEKNCFLAFCETDDVCVLTTLEGFSATKVIKTKRDISKDKSSFLTTLLNELEEEFEKEGAHSSSNHQLASQILKFHPFRLPSHNPILLHRRQKRSHMPGHEDPGDDNADSSTLTPSPFTDTTTISPTASATPISTTTKSLIATSSKTLSTTLPSIFSPSSTSSAPATTSATFASSTTVTSASTLTTTTASPTTSPTTTPCTTTCPPTTSSATNATSPNTTLSISGTTTKQSTTEEQQNTDSIVSPGEVRGQSVNNILTTMPSSVDLMKSATVTAGVDGTAMSSRIPVTQNAQQTQTPPNSQDMPISKAQTHSLISSPSPTIMHTTVTPESISSVLQPTNDVVATYGTLQSTALVTTTTVGSSAPSTNSITVEDLMSNASPTSNTIPTVGIDSISNVPSYAIVSTENAESNVATTNSQIIPTIQINNLDTNSSNTLGSDTSSSSSVRVKDPTSMIVPSLNPDLTHTANTPTMLAAASTQNALQTGVTSSGNEPTSIGPSLTYSLSYTTSTPTTNSQNPPITEVTAGDVPLSNSATNSTISHNALLLNATLAANSKGGVKHTDGVEQLGVEDSGNSTHVTAPFNFPASPHLVSTNTYTAATTSKAIAVEDNAPTAPVVESAPIANATNSTSSNQTTATLHNDIIEDNTTTTVVIPDTELAPIVNATNISSSINPSSAAIQNDIIEDNTTTVVIATTELLPIDNTPDNTNSNPTSGKLTLCQKTKLESSAAGQMLIGSYIPQCTETGEYEPIQCHGSTGYCWCVDENGEKLEGTDVGPGRGQPNCDVSTQVGVCPSTKGLFGACVEACNSDSDCNAKQMCCSNGCGHTCMNPAKPAQNNNQPLPINKAAQTVEQTTTNTPQTTTERRAPTTTVSPITTKTVTTQTTTQNEATTRRRGETTTESKSTTEVPSKTTTQNIFVEDSRVVELPSSGNKTASASVNENKKDGVTVSYLSSNGALVAAMCFGTLFLAAVCVLVGKRWYEGYQRRHYNKMDYLINGMYN